MISVRVAAFGGLRLWRDGREIDVGPVHRKAVLAALLAAGGSPVGVAELVGVVWGARPTANAVDQVHRLVGQVRRLFEPSLPARSAGKWIVPAGNGYRLARFAEITDLSEFSRVAAAGWDALREGDEFWAEQWFDRARDIAGEPPFAGLPVRVRELASVQGWEALRRRVFDISDEPPSSAFVARDDLEEALGAGDPAIVVLSGPSGAGKTALALDHAHRVADRYPDGTHVIDLRDPTPLPRAIRKAVVVLDHARDAEQVRELLPAPPGCLVLVTSRRLLTGLVARLGARHVPVGLLGPGAARELLASRIGAPRLDAEPGAADDLIRLCGGLPRDLTLVAARLAATPTARLGDVAAALASRSAYAWSYSLLSAPAKRLLSVGLPPGEPRDVGTRWTLAELRSVGMITARGTLEVDGST